MSIYDLVIYFWLKNEYDQCSLSEIALYFCLIHEANRQHWATPFKASTQMLMARLGTSKQNIMKAREGLVKRGLITCTKGEGKGKPALYTLLLHKLDRIAEQVQPLSQSLPPKLTQPLTQPLPGELSQPLPLSNNKEENIEKVEKEKVAPHHPSTSDIVVLTLSELREKLLNDERWQSELSKRLAGVGINLTGDNLKGKIIEFFEEQQSKGVAEKEEADCRSYVFYWIRYHSNRNTNHGQESRNESKGSRAEISSNRPEDYKGSC